MSVQTRAALYPDLGFTDNPSASVISGINIDIDTSEVTMWNGDAGRYVFPSDSGETMQISSTAAGDTTQTIAVVGLLGNSFVETVELVTLNGTTPVQLANQYARINDAILFSARGNPLAGRVVITGTGGQVGNQYCTIEIGEGQCFKGIYTIPAGTRARPEEIFLSINEPGNQTSTIEYRVYIGGFDLEFVKAIDLTLNSQGTNAFDKRFWAIQAFPEKTDIEITAQGSELDLSGTCYLSFVEWKDRAS